MREEEMYSALRFVAPGTPLRQALDNVIAGRTGALIAIGDEPGVDLLSNGGFVIDAPFTPQRLFELAKMDGAILLDAEATRIRRANVHLMPDPSLPTTETGMRHRTAERVSRQTEALVVSVSQRREVVTLYRNGDRISLADIDVMLAKASQALQTLERYRTRLTEVSAHLTALEFEDLVTFGDVAVVLHRFEMLRRVGRELSRYIIELGDEGRLVRMQADELTAGAEDDFVMLVRDYMPETGPRKAAAALTRIAALTPDQLLDPGALAVALGFPQKADIDEQHVRCKGYRLLHRVPLLPVTVINRLVDRFGSLKAILAATEQQLDDVDGVGTRRAKAIRDGLRRMHERAVL